MLLFELENVKKKQAYLQHDVNICKDNLAEAKNRFEIEIKRDDNSKAFGQLVRAKMESILYDHGINYIGAFVGAIGGNDCC